MKAVLSFARTYARHVGLPDEGLEAELRRRLGWLPWWGRAATCGAAAYASWLAPLLLLGKPATFDSLGADSRERLLARLQEGGRPFLRGLFLPLKSITLGALYAPRALRRNS